MSEQECEAADAALTLLLDDPSSRVRYAMADVLASDVSAPRHLIVALAKDQSNIAMLVLCRSPLFLDSELEDIIAIGDAVSLMAIACRQPLSNYVANALIKAENYVTCLALLQNTQLKLSTENLRSIANKFGGYAEIREELLAGYYLPADIRQALISEMSKALELFVVEKSWLGKSRAKTIVREARDRSTVHLARNVSVEEAPQLIERLRKSEQLTAAFLLRCVCGGNIPLFATAIANLSSIPEARIMAVLQQGRTAAFRAIYDRSGLPKAAIPAITAAVDIWRDEAELNETDDDIQVQKYVMDRIVPPVCFSCRKTRPGVACLVKAHVLGGDEGCSIDAGARTQQCCLIYRNNNHLCYNLISLTVIPRFARAYIMLETCLRHGAAQCTGRLCAA